MDFDIFSNIVNTIVWTMNIIVCVVFLVYFLSEFAMAKKDNEEVKSAHHIVP